MTPPWDFQNYESFDWYFLSCVVLSMVALAGVAGWGMWSVCMTIVSLLT